MWNRLFRSAGSLEGEDGTPQSHVLSNLPQMQAVQVIHPRRANPAPNDGDQVPLGSMVDGEGHTGCVAFEFRADDLFPNLP